jgi:hypothetical protein
MLQYQGGGAVLRSQCLEASRRERSATDTAVGDGQTVLPVRIEGPARDERLIHVVCRFHHVRDLVIITVYALEVER